MQHRRRPRSRPRQAIAFFLLMLALLSSAPAAAQRRSGAAVPNKPELGSLGERINANTVAVISGNLNATYVTIAYDLSAVLDDGDDFRILPVIGRGGGQNIKDVRFMKGVDLGITQSNLLGAYKRSNEIGPIDDKIVYIAKLFNEEMHLIVRADSGHHVDRAACRQEGELLRRRFRHAALDPRDLRPPRREGRGGQHGAGRRGREAQVRRDRRDRADRRQARGLDGAAQGRRRVSHPPGRPMRSRCRASICRRRCRRRIIRG